MLINLTITSLFTYSLASSPLFSTNVQYKLDLCQFNKIFPIVFYQTPKLNVYKTQFIKLQSELIIANSNDVTKNYTNEDLGPKFNVQTDTNFLQCRFINLGATGSLIGSVTASFTECLFYKIDSADNSFFFKAQETRQLNIIGCCFSDIKSSSSFFRSEGAKAIFLEWNIMVNSQLSKFVSLSPGDNFLCRHCNISSNKFQEVFRFDNSVDVVVESTQFNNNQLVCLLYNNYYSSKVNISSIYSINNIFELSNYDSDQYYAIFFIYCKTLCLTDSVIISSQTAISLFAPMGSSNAIVTITDNNFSHNIFNNYEFQGASSISYNNNKDIYNDIISTTVVSINSYLYYNYRHECKIYLYATTQFTESSIFTPSLAFTPSSHFTASSKFSPSSTFTASSKFTRSASFTASSEFTASSAFTPSKFFTSGPPVPSASPSVNATYGVVGAFGTAIISFGISSIIWLSIRRFCIYDHDNYLHMDV